MSFVVEPTAQPPTRPGVVTAASILLYVAAFLSLGYGGISAYANATAQPVAPPPNASPELADSTTLIAVILTVVLYVLLGVGFGVLGFLVGKGKNPARIVTWVIGGIVALCCGCSTISTALVPSFINSIDDPQLRDAFGEALASTPTWVSVTSLALAILLVVVLIVVIILLMAPAANVYFRREIEVWVPPTWLDGTPVYPAPPPVISESAFPPAPPVQFPPPQQPQQPQPPQPPQPPQSPQQPPSDGSPPPPA